MKIKYLLVFFLAIIAFSCNRTNNNDNNEMLYKFYSLDTISTELNDNNIKGRNPYCLGSAFYNKNGNKIYVVINYSYDSLIFNNSTSKSIETIKLPFNKPMNIFNIKAINEDSIYLFINTDFVNAYLSIEEEIHDIYLINSKQEILQTYDIPQLHYIATDSSKMNYDMVNISYDKNICKDKMLISCNYWDNKIENKGTEFPFTYIFDIKKNEIIPLDFDYTDVDDYINDKNEEAVFIINAVFLDNNSIAFNIMKHADIIFKYDLDSKKTELLLTDTTNLSPHAEQIVYSLPRKIKSSDNYFIMTSIQPTYDYNYHNYYKVYNKDFKLIGVVENAFINPYNNSDFFMLSDDKKTKTYLNFNADKYNALSYTDIIEQIRLKHLVNIDTLDNSIDNIIDENTPVNLKLALYIEQLRKQEIIDDNVKKIVFLNTKINCGHCVEHFITNFKTKPQEAKDKGIYFVINGDKNENVNMFFNSAKLNSDFIIYTNSNSYLNYLNEDERKDYFFIDIKENKDIEVFRTDIDNLAEIYDEFWNNFVE